MDFNFEKHSSLLLRDHNVNTSFYMHVLCHPGNDKSVFLPLSIFTKEAVVQRRSVKKLFLEVSENSQENTCARVSFLIKLQA